LTEKQIFGVVVRGLGVWFATLGVQEILRVILLAFLPYSNQGNYPIVETVLVAIVWFAVSYLLICRPDAIVELAYRPKGAPEHSLD